MKRLFTQFTGIGVGAYVALALAGCSGQPKEPQASQPSQQATQIAAMAHPYGSSDFVGTWSCTVTNGKVVVMATSTIRADGTTIGYGTAYGHTTQTYQNSWSYAPAGPSMGTMSANNMKFAPPHYTETSSVSWKGPDRFVMVTKTDTPNTAAIGTVTDCTREH